MQANRPTFYYTDGVVTHDDSIAVSAGFHTNPEADSSVILLKCGDDWGCHSVKDDLIVSLAYCPLSHSLCGLGKNGLVRRVSSAAAPFTLSAVAGRFESLQIKSPERHGPLERIRFIQRQAFACGWGGQIYRIDQQGAIDIGPQSNTTNFLDINGYSENQLYAVGMHGALWHYNGSDWQALDSPTNAHLYCIETLNDGQLLLGGAKGGLYIGRDQNWQYIGDELSDSNVWALAQFSDAIYISHGNGGLARHDINGFRSVRVANPAPSTHRLASGFGKLWSFGANDLAEFDGKQWRVVPCPENN